MVQYIRYVSNRSVRVSAQFGIEYDYVRDSQEISSILDYIGMQELTEDVTAMLVLVGDGDYNEIWVSFSNAPYYVTTRFHKIIHYYRSV